MGKGEEEEDSGMDSVGGSENTSSSRSIAEDAITAIYNSLTARLEKSLMQVAYERCYGAIHPENNDIPLE